MENIKKQLDMLEEEYINFWADICRIESPTSCKEGVDAVCDYITEKAEKRGWKVEVQQYGISGKCACITMNPESESPAVCFSGHMDTVHPIGSFGEDVVRIENGNIYGPGVTDCKGGIVASFMAMAALENCGYKKRPLKLILQSDEETSSVGSNLETVKFMCEKAKGCAAFFNCEGHGDNSVTVERKGILRCAVEIWGKAAHSAKCYEGVNAICEAAYKIIEFEKMKDKEGITINCGTISGGTADNTVAEYCCFHVDIRFRNSEQMKFAENMVKEISEKSFIGGTTSKVSVLSKRIPMEYSEKNIELLNSINKIYEQHGMPVLRGAFRPGGSDAAYTTAAGIPTLDSFGTSGDRIHSTDESGEIASLKQSAMRLAAAANFLSL